MPVKWDHKVKRERMGRFAAKYSTSELLVVVRAVARRANPTHPEKATQKAFDAARSRAGYPDCPKAQHIAQRFNRSWGQSLELAFDPVGAIQSIDKKDETVERELLTRGEITNALKLVAEELEQDHLSRAKYDQERNRILGESERGWAHGGGASQILPSSAAITQKMKTWEQALDLAGLTASPPERTEVYPNENALDDFIADYGWAPTRKMLVAYQHRRGLSVRDFDGDWTPWVRQQLRSGLASRHGQVEIVQTKNKAPQGWENQTISPAPSGYARPRPRQVPIEDIEADVRHALDLAGDQNLTQDLYRTLVRHHGLIAFSTVQRAAKRERNQTWGEFVAVLVAERAKQPRKQGRRKP